MFVVIFNFFSLQINSGFARDADGACCNSKYWSNSLGDVISTSLIGRRTSIPLPRHTILDCRRTGRWTSLKDAGFRT